MSNFSTFQLLSHPQLGTENTFAPLQFSLLIWEAKITVFVVGVIKRHESACKVM